MHLNKLNLFNCLLMTATLFELVLAWKPIAGGTTATTSYATSFRLKQIHPELETKRVSLNTHDLIVIPTPITQQEVAKIESMAYKDPLLLSQKPLPRIQTRLMSASPINYDDEAAYGYSFDDNREVTIPSLGEDRCAVKKFALNYDGIVKYNNEIPEMNQFTICFWMRFTNHSGDHVILTYSVKDEPREIQFWVANSRNSSFISMALKGQQVYRLNYPLRMRQWHHACSSWNGKTGEWQVWMKAERIGRGFHNSLVGHKIPAKGKLFSGGNSMTGEVSPGLHFEITFVQIYRIALSAGKAHRDHKHHHVHHFDHEGQELMSTTKAPPAINRPLPMNQLLANGQIPTRLMLNLAQSTATPLPTGVAPVNYQGQSLLNANKQAVTIQTNFVNGQINTGSRLLAQQLIGLRAGPRVPQATQRLTTQTLNINDNPADHQFIDTTETRIFFKRHASKVNGTEKMKPEKISKRRRINKEKKVEKRELVILKDGTLVDDSLLNDEIIKYEGLADFGDQHFKDGLNVKMNIDDEVAEHDREPAEEEVKAVMNLCSACDIEPFQGAIVFAWKNIADQMDNALKGQSVGRCGYF